MFRKSLTRLSNKKLKEIALNNNRLLMYLLYNIISNIYYNMIVPKYVFYTYVYYRVIGAIKL